ncbi:MAG: hypothetical protein Q9211_004750, partial [Gyalolechia sp. 1 TL-2023]
MEQECQKLRLELKGWEKAFAAANQGRKAGREDIKQNAEIGTFFHPPPSPHPSGFFRQIGPQISQFPVANKYKRYNKLRAGEACSRAKNDAPRRRQSPTKRRAEKPPPDSTETPRKRSKHLHATQDDVANPEQVVDPSETTPIAHRKAIGPTPQKNGRVLGIFDLLTPSSTFRTPSKTQSLAPLPTNV